MTKYKTLLFYLTYVVALLPLFIFRDFTPDNELRYLSIVDEALSNHTFFAFTNHAIPYADKPPFYLWCLMALRSLSGGHFLWLYSIFTLIPALIIACVFKNWTYKIIPYESRLVSQGMLLVSGLFLASVIVLRMDMLMCLFIVLAFYEFWKITENPDNARPKWLLPLFVFIAIFTKGPYGFLIPFAGTIVYSIWIKKYRYLAAAWGWRFWMVLIPLCVLWFGMVFLEGGSEYLNNLLFHQTMDRAVNSFHHAKPFYYYMISIWYSLIPWSLAILGLIIAGFIKKKHTEGLQTYFIVISLTTFVLLSCVSSKIQIYLLPAIPFMVYAAAISIPRYQKDGLVKGGLAIIGVVFIFVLPALGVFNHLQPSDSFNSVWCWIAAGSMTGAGIMTIFFLYFKKSACQVNNGIYSLIYGLLVSVFFAGFALPKFNDNIGYRNLAEKIIETSESTGISEIKFWKVRRPENMDVYLHREVDIIDNENFNPEIDCQDLKPYILVADGKKIAVPPSKNTQVIGKYIVTIIE